MEKTSLYENTACPVRYPHTAGMIYPNHYAFMFLYAPAFDFPEVEGAAGYHYEILDDIHKEYTMTAPSPNEPLSAVWEKLPTGFVTVWVYGLDSDGRKIGLAGKRTFWKKAPFKPGSYEKKRRSYRETARLILENRFQSEEVQKLLRGEDPAFYYPTKQLAALIRGMARRAKSFPETREDSLRVVKHAADLLIDQSEGEDAPLAGFTPTYQKETREEWQGTTMLLYPAFGINAFLEAYEVTGDDRYLKAATLGAATFLRLQGEDGSWPLVMSLKDGSVVKANRCMTVEHMSFFKRLYDLTGEEKYIRAADRAFDFIEKGPLKNWNWEGQFEDTPASEPYRNLTKHDACSVAIYLTARYPDDPGRIAEARELLRFAEDLFVNWEKPFTGGRVYVPEKDFGEYNHYWDIEEWIMPSVFEQYGCFTPVDASAAKLIKTYLALYKVEEDPLDLEKARTLGDAITRMTDDDGLESTWWNTKELRTSVWPNCMLASEEALELLLPYEN